MKELVSYIVRQVVDEPNSVTVTEETNGNQITIEIRAEKSERGKIIGKQGNVINAIRTLAHAAGSKDNMRVTITIPD